MSEKTVKTLPEISYPSDDIRAKIYVIRGVQVMLDSDLAQLYGVETKALNQTVKRNIDRFPSQFCFRLNENETSELVTNCDRLAKLKHSSVCPYAFTESGVAMLSALLRSEIAVRTSIMVINAFVSMRHYLSDNAMVFQRLDRIELKQLEADEKFKQIFKQLDVPKQNKAVIFFKGQMWDATSCIEEIIGEAKKSIILIDGYVDKGTLDMLTKKKSGVYVEIHTIRKNFGITQKEIYTFSAQYGPLSIKFTDEFHDRFMILDKKSLYHIGASIKDAGKKTFEISLNDDEKMLTALLSRL